MVKDIKVDHKTEFKVTGVGINEPAFIRKKGAGGLDPVGWKPDYTNERPTQTNENKVKEDRSQLKFFRLMN